MAQVVSPSVLNGPGARAAWALLWRTRTQAARRQKFLSLLAQDAHQVHTAKRLRTLIRLGLSDGQGQPSYSSAPSATLDAWQTTLDADLRQTINTVFPNPLDQEGNLDRMRLLLAAGAHPDAVDLLGRPPLMLALMADQMPMFQCLLDAGADPLICDLEGCSLMHRVGISFQPTFAAFQPGFCRTPPHIIHDLHALGLDVNQPDLQGQRPLHAALKAGNPDAVLQCLDQGADPTLPDTSIPWHPTSFHLLVMGLKSPPCEWADRVLDRLPIAGWSVGDANGRTPYEMMCKEQKVAIHHANMGWTPLVQQIDFWLPRVESIVLNRATPASNPTQVPSRMRL